VFRRGDAATHIYLLTQGRVSVRLYRPDDASYQRLATFTAGHVFGEMAVIDAKPRSADVWTESGVRGHAISVAALDELAEQHPAVKLKLYQYLLRTLSTRLRKANDQIEQLAQ
jgi:CRP-like cAMP-binding protein